MRTGSWSRLPRIDQRKQDEAGLRAAIDPRVIGGLLDDERRLLRASPSRRASCQSRRTAQRRNRRFACDASADASLEDPSPARVRRSPSSSSWDPFSLLRPDHCGGGGHQEQLGHGRRYPRLLGTLEESRDLHITERDRRELGSSVCAREWVAFPHNALMLFVCTLDAIFFRGPGRARVHW